jgi:carbamoyl-phosphate synthase large subunit
VKDNELVRRLLILRAGSGPGNTLMRSLKAGDPSLFMVGCHHDRFEIKKSSADRNYLVSPFARAEFRRALRNIIKAERIDLVIPTHYVDVRTISNLRDSIPCRVFLPRKTVIARCQDKYRLTTFLGRRGVPVPLTHPVTRLKDIEQLFRRFRSARELWCRIRVGTGSAGAILVRSPEQTRSWIKYWEEVCAMPAGAFTLSEYLPGRDFCVQSLWKGGKLMMARSHERLSYLVVGGGPSNVSSMAALARIIYEPRVFEVGTNAIRALDAKASGVFFVDIKENAAGKPCVTEINAGRFASVSLAHDVAGPDNMALAYVRVALGERATTRRARIAEDCYVLRGLDALPTVLRADELSDGIVDWTG